MMIKRFLSVSFLLLLMCSCKYVGPKQHFEIVSGYEGQLAYVEAMLEDPNAVINVLYNEKVVDPYYSECVEGGEYIPENSEPIQPIRDLEQLAYAIDELKFSNVNKLVEAALKRSANELPGSDTLICIFVLDPSTTYARENMNGVSGFTAGSGRILLFLYPEENWEEVIKYTVAHEYHHSVWTEKYYDASKHFDLIEYMIFEGRADSFANIIYPDVAIPWVERLPLDQEENQWETMQQYLDEESYELRSRYMFGDSIIPQWAGYKIGYQIVQAYLSSHPDANVEDWTELDARELLEESGYN